MKEIDWDDHRTCMTKICPRCGKHYMHYYGNLGILDTGICPACYKKEWEGI